MAQFVFSMHRLGKIVPPKREILKDISLSFFPGAKPALPVARCPLPLARAHFRNIRRSHIRIRRTADVTR